MTREQVARYVIGRDWGGTGAYLLTSDGAQTMDCLSVGNVVVLAADYDAAIQRESAMREENGRLRGLLGRAVPALQFNEERGLAFTELLHDIEAALHHGERADHE